MRLTQYSPDSSGQDVSRDQRGRLLTATERMERSSDTLAGARRTVAETEDVGKCTR